MTNLRSASLALFLFALLGLGGCGGGGGSDTTTASMAAQGGTGAGGDRQSTDPYKAPDTSNLPQPTEGSKQAAAGVPVPPGGDDSIQLWGTEASSSEREQVTQVVKTFLNARAAADWAKACRYLAARPFKELGALIKGSKKGNAACAQAMASLAQGVPSRAFDDEARIDYVLSLRVGKGNAFLIYTRRGSNKVYATGLADEGGTWKVVSVGPTVLGS
jgi:hypothetical protein